MVGCRWLYRHKFDSKGNLDRYEGQCVAQGFSQLPSLDFDDTFSLVIKPATIRIVLSIAMSKNWPIHQLDVKNAFLDGDLSEEVYMKQPSSYVQNFLCFGGRGTEKYGKRRENVKSTQSQSSSLLAFAKIQVWRRQVRQVRNPGFNLSASRRESAVWRS
ncbi:hypothetical protein OSB04_006530 [Centaurea solstitialis]|uniref:Reverse transcriptase Ty1/copia-type domain-containing protein n=1 Tax=Centaurea solstitialis TaxID=347529 RepID=A0AA38TUT0_9ASTR|nr:hypothetical protein OSB04_006530 [Centaurea solstitialis]